MITPARRKAGELLEDYLEAAQTLKAAVEAEANAMSGWQTSAMAEGIASPAAKELRSTWEAACQRRDEAAREAHILGEDLASALRAVEKEGPT